MDWKWNQNVGLKVSSLQNEFYFYNIALVIQNIINTTICAYNKSCITLYIFVDLIFFLFKFNFYYFVLIVELIYKIVKNYDFCFINSLHLNI